jgi:hypothetical protein
LTALSAMSVSQVAASNSAPTSRFVPITPTRVIDSRSGLGTTTAPIAAGQSRDLQITGATVPKEATAVLVNVTATNTRAGGWLQLFPTGRAEIGSSSTLNLDRPGSTLPNASFAPLGDGGRMTVYSTFQTDVILDVAGYFLPATESDSGRFFPASPTRILDTRSRLGWTPPSPGDVKDCSSFPTQAAAQAWFDAYVDLYGDVARLDQNGNGVACESGEQPTTAPAPVAPVNPVAPVPPVTPPPAPPATPTAPPNPGDTKNCSDFATYAEAKAWFDTYFPFYGDVAKLDGNGDGRPCESLPGGPARRSQVAMARVLPGTTVTLQVSGRGGLPTSGISAVVLNVTAVDPTSEGWVQVGPTPVVVGASSNLNTTPGVTAANLVVVPLSSSGTVDLYSTTGGDLLADVFGYFSDSSVGVGTAGLFVPVVPQRGLDTRGTTQGRGVGSGVAVMVDLADKLPAVSAFAGNLTATNASPGGYLQIGPFPLRINTHSNLNTAYAGQTVANAVVTPMNRFGDQRIVQVYSFGNADILLDITGYFT